MTGLFDSHTHINIDGIDEEERAEIIAAIEKSDVAAVVDVGFDVKSSAEAAARAARLPWCFASVGIHPHDAETADRDAYEQITRLSKLPGVVAIGEIGLDFYRDLSPRDVQRDAFKRQIAIALEERMPIIIHDRDSDGESVSILISEGAFSGERKSQFDANPVSGTADARVLLHCYSGTLDQALEYIAMGASISIAGPVTYKNNEELHEVARGVPLEHMMIETDAPYLAPVPYRGKRNISPYIEYTAAAVADLRGITYEQLVTATFANAERFFGVTVGK